MIAHAHRRWFVLLTVGFLLVLVAASLAIGRFPITLGELLRAVWSKMADTPSGVPTNVETILWEVRAPRIVAALVVGAALAAAGSVYQNIFRNPLVSPDILGVSSGCALGAVFAILLSLPAIGIQILAFIGGLTAVLLVYRIGTWIRGHDRVLTLILTGVAVGSLLASGIALAKYVADPYQQLPAITFWLLGSFSGVLPQDLYIALPLVVVGVIALVLLRWRINLLSLPDDEASALGVQVSSLRLAVVLPATLITAAAVAIAGVIGWIGLIVPHAARLLVGAEFSRVLPMSMLLGAAFMLIVDSVGRAFAQIEIPPGVVTAMIGSPIFIWLLAVSHRQR